MSTPNLPAIYGNMYLLSAQIDPRCVVMTNDSGEVVVSLTAPGAPVYPSMIGTPGEVMNLCARIVAAVNDVEPEPRFVLADIPPHDGLATGGVIAAADAPLIGERGPEVNR